MYIRGCSTPTCSTYAFGLLIYLTLFSSILHSYGNQALVTISLLFFPMDNTQQSPELTIADNSPVVLGTAYSLIVSCTVFVILRYYSRYLSNTAFSIEDVIIPFAWLAEMALCGVSINCVENGLGRHRSNLDPVNIENDYKGLLLQEFLHPAAVAFPKLIVAILFLRVLNNKYERFAAKLVIFLIVATCISYTIAPVFQCTPIAFNWSDIPGGSCFNIPLFAQSSSIPNVTTDVGVLLLPLRMVWHLKISVPRRIGLFLIFLTGSVGIVASIVRACVSFDAYQDMSASPDFTWNSVPFLNMTMIEPGVYLLSACAISFKPLLRMLVKALHFGSQLTSTRYRDSGRRSHVKPSGTHDNLAAYESLYDIEPGRNVSDVGASYPLSEINKNPSQESRGDIKSGMTVQSIQTGRREGVQDNKDGTDVI
ncbi:integral membrane [Pyrenophora seminiperda CCB06]|uniref:Integral membrane n=1 Tax=Pyrenophora seminiperda CCB06 TaxID=1302712 RepID=A0A3M7M6S7_9PLEO|nr:integral membrane [Pyrenophora seminiperda CCB06]